MEVRRRSSQAPGLATAAAAARATTSSASSNTQHSHHGASAVSKRPAQDVPIGKSKRPKYAAALLPAAHAAASSSSSSSSSSSTDDSDDTAVSGSESAPLTFWEAEQLCAAVVAGERSLRGVLLQLLYTKGQQAFVSYLRYTLQQELQQQQQQQQQQQCGTPALLDALTADNCSLLTEFLQTLSHPDIVTSYNAAIAFQVLAVLAGADRVLKAVLAAPQGVLLLLAALNESRLRMAYQQGFVITVCYSGRAVREPLCSGTVGCMIKCARKQDLESLIRQLLPMLTWNDESAVSAAMSLVIIARNAESGVELLLPHTSLLLAAVQQHWRVSKRVLLALRIMAETAAAAAAVASPCISASAEPVAAAAAVPSPLAAAAAAMAQTDLTPLLNLVLHGTQESAALAADIILALVRSVPDHPGLLNLVPDLVQGYQYLGPVSWHALQTVQILRQITAGSTAGTAAVLPHVGGFLALQFVTAMAPEFAEVRFGIIQQQQQQQEVPELHLLVTADPHMLLLNQTIKQLAAEVVADLAARPAAAVVLSQQQHVRLLLSALQQQLLLAQQHLIMGDESNVVFRSLLGAVRCLAATQSGQLALADHECMQMLFQIMQQDLDQGLSRSPGFQGFTDTVLEVLLRMIMAAAVGGLRSPTLGPAAAAAAAAVAGSAEQQAAPATVDHLAEGSSARFSTTAAGVGGGVGPVAASSAVDLLTTYSTQLANLLIKALKPVHIKLLINIGHNPSFTVRVLHCLIPLCKFPGGCALLEPHANDMLQIVRGILPATVGKDIDHYLGSLIATAEAVVRGIVGRQLYQQQQQQQ